LPEPADSCNARGVGGAAAHHVASRGRRSFAFAPFRVLGRLGKLVVRPRFRRRGPPLGSVTSSMLAFDDDHRWCVRAMLGCIPGYVHRNATGWGLLAVPPWPLQIAAHQLFGADHG
jgi:hypothetical protein